MAEHHKFHHRQATSYKPNRGTAEKTFFFFKVPDGMELIEWGKNECPDGWRDLVVFDDDSNLKPQLWYTMSMFVPGDHLLPHPPQAMSDTPHFLRIRYNDIPEEEFRGCCPKRHRFEWSAQRTE